MSDQALVRRYAQVLYDEGEIASVQADMGYITRTLEGAHDLRQVLASPIVPHEKKLSILEAVLGAGVHAVTLRFVRLLLRRRREFLLGPVASAYQSICDEHQGVTHVKARVPFPLSDSETRRVQRVLRKKMNSEVRLEVTEDASLIGGIVLHVGDVVYDGSVANQLERLHKQII